MTAELELKSISVAVTGVVNVFMGGKWVMDNFLGSGNGPYECTSLC